MVRFPKTRAWLEQLLHTHDTPQRTASAYALGVFFGFSPLLGLHTVLGLIFAAYINGVARQPEARGMLQPLAFLGFALTEALAIFGIALAFVFR